ncbi:hypothetical protein JAAARDRAFT_206354 [Jaapia argillacea MUCL 33604]|uniref:Uncharacterized protein n=1 Tax=Jaapia argillacea MUCL 33604 TaxID=933084 RepID=A0A067PX61_9AGAM|nr:hypothetical protein JAAARDRAFT_206354 [Jaapia argillacea MUCL 33604]
MDSPIKCGSRQDVVAALHQDLDCARDEAESSTSPPQIEEEQPNSSQQPPQLPRDDDSSNSPTSPEGGSDETHERTTEKSCQVDSPNDTNLATSLPTTTPAGFAPTSTTLTPEGEVFFIPRASTKPVIAGPRLSANPPVDTSSDIKVHPASTVNASTNTHTDPHPSVVEPPYYAPRAPKKQIAVGPKTK